ncbi:MAG: hypothetical protein ABI656_01890, partial [bacterium]
MNRKNIHSIPAMFNVAVDGWCREALRIASPNSDARPVGTAIDLLVPYPTGIVRLVWVSKRTSA